MRALAVVSTFASGCGAARIQIDTAEADLTAESISLGSPSFPNTVMIRNAETQWSEEMGGHAQQLLFAEDNADVMEGVGAAPPHVIGHSNKWVIEQHQGTSAFTICNPHNCRCLFATDQRTVGASDLGFQDDQLWTVEHTDSDRQLYTITHMTSGLRLYRGGMSNDEFGIGDDANGHRERVWPDQTWHIEDRADSNEATRCQLPPVFPNHVLIRNAENDRMLYAGFELDGMLNMDIVAFEGARLPPVRGMLLENYYNDRYTWATGYPNQVRPRFSWAIEQYQGTRYSTICNAYFGRCLYVPDGNSDGSTAVEATRPDGNMIRDLSATKVSDFWQNSFSDSQLWIIEPTGDGKYTVTHRNSRLRLFAGEPGLKPRPAGMGPRNTAPGPSDESTDGWGASDGGGPNQEWYIEDRTEKCASDWRRSGLYCGEQNLRISDCDEVYCTDIEACMAQPWPPSEMGSLMWCDENGFPGDGR